MIWLLTIYLFGVDAGPATSAEGALMFESREACVAWGDMFVERALGETPSLRAAKLRYACSAVTASS